MNIIWRNLEMLKLIKFELKQYTRPIGLSSLTFILSIPLVVNIVMLLADFDRSVMQYANLAYMMYVMLLATDYTFLSSGFLLKHIPISYKKVYLAKLVAHLPAMIITTVSYELLSFVNKAEHYEMGMPRFADLSIYQYPMLFASYIFAFLLIQSNIIDKSAIIPRVIKKLVDIPLLENLVVGIYFVLSISLSGIGMISFGVIFYFAESMSSIETLLITIAAVILSVAVFYLNANLLEKSSKMKGECK